MKLSFLSFCCIFILPISTFASEAEDLLKASDRARGGIATGVTWQVRIESIDNGTKSDRSFIVKAKELDAIAESVKPAKFKGEIFLFNDRTMWFFKPSLRRPVAISARQRLTGQAANGDIAATNYARDYTAEIERTEVIKGQSMKVLLLKAKSDQVTYEQIRYWVAEKSKLAIKAEFMTLQGEAFKHATFEYKNSILVNKKKTPFISKMVIKDVKNGKNQSIMSYSQLRLGSLPPAIFNINNLSR